MYEVPLVMSLLGFRCLMISLSGHCELLFLLCFIAYGT